jgi:OmcA/MtrC family decaheme c-type cytochrome
MITGGIGYGSAFYQTNVPGYLPKAVDTTTNPATPAMLGFHVTIPNVTKLATVTGNIARRTIVATAKCESCHATLGVFTTANFHSGGRNDATSCAFCHTVNQTSSGWAADSRSFIHAVHAGSKRTVPYTWHAVSATDTYAKITYPAILNNCEACHVPGSYDYSASANASAMPNLLWSTVGANSTGTPTYPSTAATAYTYSPYITQDLAYGLPASFTATTGAFTQAAATTLVNSPITGACTACHDSKIAIAHMQGNGGAFYEARSTALAKVEQCLICHGNGKTADIRAVHMTF